MSYEETGRLTRDSSAGIPILRKARKIITPAQVATLFTVPVLIVPGAAGRLTVPTHIHCYKQAGTAWTVGTPGQLGLANVGGGGAHSFLMFNQTATQNFFNNANESWWIAEAGKGSSAGFGDDQSNLIAGNGHELHLTSANISGGTGNLIVTVFYRIWGKDKP